MVIILLIMVAISYILFLSLARAASKDNHKDFEELNEELNSKENE